MMRTVTQFKQQKEFEYISILAAYGLKWEVDGHYLIHRSEDQKETSRVYISVVCSQISKMLSLIGPELVKNDIGFAVVKNADSAKAILNGTYGPEHVGKVMILFLPVHKDHLSERISELLSVFSGPVVPGRLRLGNCLYGNPNPVANISQRPKVQVLNGKYIALIVLKSVPKGDVIRAIYLNRFMFPVWCIIKEAKYKMISDDAGLDMGDRLKWQYRIHEELSSVVNMPKVIDLFNQDQNTYLVTQHIKGITLRKAIDRTYRGKMWFELPCKKRSYLLEILLDICGMVGQVHDYGYLHRDLSTANFMITKRRKIFLLDWELAYDQRSENPLPPFGFGTPGFTFPEQGKGVKPQVKEDIYGLTSLMIAVFTGLRPADMDIADYDSLFLIIRERTRESLIAHFLRRGVSRLAKERPDIEEIKAFISHIYHNNSNSHTNGN
ncbi:protein kinase domain-containing protein [Pedobacter suwonensis]|uniref:protein kinase domain-containing protein n=1 Tax=Pedobacter suwonensis TaxID=332999 RepID=UPI0036946A32